MYIFVRIFMVLVFSFIVIMFVGYGLTLAGMDSSKMQQFINNPCSVPEMRMWMDTDQKIRCEQVDAIKQSGTKVVPLS